MHPEPPGRATLTPAPTPPIPERRPRRLVAHGDTRIDDWYWLGDREDPAVEAHLRAENAYADAVLAPTAGLRDRLYRQLRDRIQETDASAPVRIGPWWYYTRTVEGREYGVHCRRPDPHRRLAAADVLAGDGPETVLLDENAEAEGAEYFALGVFDVSPDHRLVAWADDRTGDERYTLHLRELTNGFDLDDVVDDVSYGSAWSADCTTLFYVRPDAANRPCSVWRHVVGAPAADDVMVWEEPDERFFVSLSTTRSERFVVISSDSKITSEIRLLDAGDPSGTPTVVCGREEGHEYSVDHARRSDQDGLVMLSNAGGAEDFALWWSPLPAGDRSSWESLVAHRPGVRLEGVDGFDGFALLSERKGGLERLRVLPLGAEGVEDHLIDQPEPAYSLGAAGNGEWATSQVRFAYTSLVTPASAIDHDIRTGRRTVVKQQPVLGGYDPSAFRTERIWAPAGDGTSIPISLVHREGLALDGSAPCLLYGYGSYEISIDPTFSSLRLNLLERGVVFAIAHIRGGGELGRRWYEDGKLLHKRNTFDDFVACAEELVRRRYTSPASLAIRGGSAGGLLMGAVTNARPDLWRAVVAEVPFVDCLTTMQDPSLPLTVTEWEEWGNPVEDPEVYACMRSYSPYDNVTPGRRPAMYVTAGLNDPRVGYWEPTKWVAKLRDLSTGGGPVLLRTEMDAGHGGPSGRYQAWEDEARIQAFLLWALGVEPA